MKKKAVIISVSVIIVVLIVAGTYLIFVGNPMKDVKKKLTDDRFPLKSGSTHSGLVEELQKKLNAKGQNLTVDGDFGPKTTEALKAVTGKSEITKSEFNKL